MKADFKTLLAVPIHSPAVADNGQNTARHHIREQNDNPKSNERNGQRLTVIKKNNAVHQFGVFGGGI